MLRRISQAALALAASSVLLVPTTSGDAIATERAPSPRWAEITRIEGGFRYLASRYDSNLSITRSGDRVVFHDRAMRRFREALPAGCRRLTVERGIAASCRIPGTPTAVDPMDLVIAPLAGADRVDGSTLSTIFKLTVRGGAGDDTATGGAGDDALDGGLGVDQMTGGIGDDVIRVGPGHDIGDGGVGEDRLIGTDGADHLSGGEGEDQLEGGKGNDTLLGGPAADILLCGDGFDTTDDDGMLDSQVHNCEQVVP